MDLVFVVPGIMGSELHLNGVKLWPPKPLGSVSNPDRLLDPNVIVHDIIRNVLFFGFYDKLLKPLQDWGYREHQPGRNGLVVTWPYNWVRGIPESALELASDIRAAIRQYPDADIVLLAHSMGGLVCTYALECLAEPDMSWRDRVRLFVTFGTPFRGAPESLKNALGAEGTTGISAKDCRRLMADPRFPSAYQLLPHLSTSSVWSGLPPLEPLPDYQTLDPAGPALGSANLNAAIAFQQALQNGTALPHVRAFNFCGGRYGTVWSVGTPDDPKDILDPYEAKAGDGTVPSWSGRQRDTVQFAPLGAKHSTTFGDDELLDVLHELLVKPTAPKGAGPGPGKLLARRPAPPPRMQPRVSVTKNVISSFSDDVEVEIFEPPSDGTLHLAWVPVDEVETVHEFAHFLERADFNVVAAEHSLALPAELGFPLRVSIRRPPRVGRYALAAWSGERMRTLAGLEADRMDVVWVFADQQDGETSKGGSSNIVAPIGPLSVSIEKPKRGVQEHASPLTGYLTED